MRYEDLLNQPRRCKCPACSASHRDDFYEDDEPIERIRAIRQRPYDFVTASTCSNAENCGNTATAVREVQGRQVRMCESCAAEHDERGE